MEKLILSIDKIIKCAEKSYSENDAFESVLDCFNTTFSKHTVFITNKNFTIIKSKCEEINSLHFDFNKIFSYKFINDVNEISKNKFSEFYINDFYSIFLPLIFAGRTLGGLFIYGKESFSEGCILCAKMIALYFSGIVFEMDKVSEKSDEMERDKLRSALGTLSYSEYEAIIGIFENLNGNEGIFIMKKISEKINVTRSIIVNALRKIESAGFIECRSLGMKGTHIKVLSKIFIEEINKIKK